MAHLTAYEIERLDDAQYRDGTHYCPVCQREAKDNNVIGETGWYFKLVAYRCKCGKWFKTTI